MSPRPRRPTCSRAPLAWLLAGGALTAGCAPAHGPSPATPVAAPSGACLLTTDSVGAPRTLTAAFDDSTDARRARLAAALDAPIRLDCEGRPSPALAAAWSRDTSGRFWTLELGPPGSGGQAAGWSASALAGTWRADPEAGAALRWAGVESLLPLDERRLVVGFATPRPDLPAVFADRSLGVARREPGDGLEILSVPGNDFRDALDRGADLIQTSDPDLLDYARRSPGLTTVPLPWSRIYLLILPSRDGGVGAAIPADTAAFRTSLARDAVRADARPAAAPFWWDSVDGCRPKAVAPPGSTADMVVYPAADPTARGLAERLVALAGLPELTARGLAADSFALALRQSAGRAFVASAPRHALVPCRESDGWPAAATVVPLIETRTHVVLRRGAPALAVDWDGAVRTVP